jgi:lysine-specific demethylase 8
MYPAPQKPGDYLRSQVRLDRPADFPLFEGATLHTSVVGPGDMLYIPAHWWHYILSLEPSMTVTFWWRASRIIELLGQFAEAARAGSLPSFLARNSGSLGLRDVEELGGETALREIWAPLPPRVQKLCTQLLSAEVARLVAA